MRARAFVVATLAAAGGLALLASCSLLAPSDEEAMRGLGGTDGGTARPDGRVVVGDGAVDVGEGGAATKGVECGGQTCFACNEGVCAGCWMNGAKCDGDDDCCGGDCNDGICGAPVASCKDAGAPCAAVSECCGGLTCATADGGRTCQACRPLGADCAAGVDCCSRRCGADKKCAPCVALGEGCGGDQDCCTGECQHPKDFCEPFK